VPDRSVCGVMAKCALAAVSGAASVRKGVPPGTASHKEAQELFARLKESDKLIRLNAIDKPEECSGSFWLGGSTEWHKNAERESKQEKRE
jgi:hypothetical protein